ncbi:unnamed protein product [Clonostachys rhizophaga]|uniref:Uncharacterized protein n=1 Tax=Clonostachys rhizophaga TaxID=160324 RepID=A0A9N9VHL7_9HYPO|nr:unnamed protein product [Clonostachys rhizophaga]
MRFATIAASASVFVAGTQASGPSARNDPHISDFRLWGSPTCSGTQNYGIWTILQSDTGKCTSLHLNDPTGPSIYGIGLGDISDNFKLFIFAEDDCSGEPIQATLGGCDAAESEWKSFIVRQ